VQAAPAALQCARLGKECAPIRGRLRALAMNTYLKIINPVVAVVVLLLCIWASMNGDNGFQPWGMLRGGIPTYFLAKGLFCSSALFLVGRILLLMSEKSGK
jgi:hypothetical protein